MDQTPKIIVFCAPSGSGKTTIARAVVEAFYKVLKFSISAVTRNKRINEKEGIDYYFLTVEEFMKKVENNEFAEWEEVYPGILYGTLKSEIEGIANKVMIAVLDIDIKGARSIKNIYGDNALVIFIKAPVEEIKARLEKRATDTPKAIQTRLDRIPLELAFEPEADVVINNIDLTTAIEEAKKKVFDFLHMSH